MQMRQLYVLPVLVAAAAAAVGIAVAPTAAADCNYSGGSTLCASGTVRGSNGAPTSTPAYDPYPCTNDPLCLYYDDYDPFVVLNPPDFDFGRPGRPGGGGGGGGGGPIIQPR
jgi:hypothetical protein